ncbi:C-di-GMP-specific phosphodiesterase [Weissella koreensis KACC 15510]|uniref:hypothetical protein n=1 Tax=Weissella koreensis TaxID=165096 RepID=UPI0002174B01|nr:hypothetical protein [Weissella koreensis]AEJ23255.1 C-di-GMP-specific phosphodiesterase [Weissella koreensis KACC 15510]
MILNIAMLIILSLFIIFGVLITINLFWAKHQNGIYSTGDIDMSYRYGYFIQSIIDENGNKAGYEALLRYYDPVDQKWKFPTNFKDFSLREIIPLLKDVLPRLNEESGFLSINITLNQMYDLRYEWFIRWARGTIYPMKLRIEISITDDYKPNLLVKRNIIKNLKKSKELDVDVILEKIESTNVFLKKVKWMFKDISGIKIPFSQYRKTGEDQWVDINMGEWKRIATSYGFEIDVTELENSDDIELADNLKLKYRQGYLIDKPNYGESDFK